MGLEERSKEEIDLGSQGEPRQPGITFKNKQVILFLNGDQVPWVLVGHFVGSQYIQMGKCLLLQPISTLRR